MNRRYLATIVILFSLCAIEAKAQTPSFKLFSPLKYYPSVTKDIMNQDSASQSLEDRILLDMYLKHPEMVENPEDVKVKDKSIVSEPDKPPTLSLTDTTKT